MDKRTRVLNAMNKKEVDHVPVGFWFHFAGEEASGEGCIKAHLKYYRETDLDFVKIMCDGYFPYPLPEIREAADWKTLQPLTADHPFIREQVERAKAIVDDIGKERCVFYNVFAPFSSLRFGAEAVGLSDADVMEYIRTDKNAVMQALDVIAQTNALLAELLITEAGCDGVYYCVQGGEYDRFTPDYPAKVVNWAVFVEGLTLDAGRYFIGGRTSLGGFETHWDEHTQQGIIYTGTKEEVQKYTTDMILNHGKIGLMLGGDCTIDAKLDWERIRWVVEAARSI